MLRKILLCALSLSLLMSGCSRSTQIDRASLVQTVTVTENDGKLVYGFHLLSGESEGDSAFVSADSLKQAVRIAEEKYIPDLSLSKLELLAINESVCNKVLRGDMMYIAESDTLSPLVNVAVTDEGTARLFAESTEAFEEAEKRIILFGKENPKAKTDVLTLYNALTAEKAEAVILPRLTFDGSLRVSGVEIKCGVWSVESGVI